MPLSPAKRTAARALGRDRSSTVHDTYPYTLMPIFGSYDPAGVIVFDLLPT
ncbi:hypothetical protein [Mycobacterium intermedium]|uniref:hypothetical protein n=1 Tax=Mycobacterium intermedium TaxID=28445 RepID=UPI0039E822B3